MTHRMLVFGGIAAMVLMVGVAVNIMADGIDNPGPIVIIIIMSIVYLKSLRIVHGSERGGGATASGERSERLDRLEQRMADLQDIVIAIDDKLQRAQRDPSPTA